MAKAFPVLTVSVDGDIATNAPVMLHVRLAELLHFAENIHDPDRVEDLHAMRIAAKRLRYTLEIFQQFAPQGEIASSFSNQTLATKAIQEKIGEIHDHDVRIPLVYSYLNRNGKKNPEIKTGLARLINDECQSRDSLYGAFLRHWDQARESYIAGMMSLISAISIVPHAMPTLQLSLPEPGSDVPKPKSNGRRAASTSKA